MTNKVYSSFSIMEEINTQPLRTKSEHQLIESSYQVLVDDKVYHVDKLLPNNISQKAKIQFSLLKEGILWQNQKNTFYLVRCTNIRIVLDSMILKITYQIKFVVILLESGKKLSKKLND